jgi:hypothetical protein
MGWAEDRVEDYQSGQRATWLERRTLERANPVHFPLALAAGAVFAIGLWTHDWRAIAVAAVLALSGHVYCWTCKPAINPFENDAPGRGDGKRRRSSQDVDVKGNFRAGSLVCALSWYGSHGRARRAALAQNQREGEASRTDSGRASSSGA